MLRRAAVQTFEQRLPAVVWGTSAPSSAAPKESPAVRRPERATAPVPRPRDQLAVLATAEQRLRSALGTGAKDTQVQHRATAPPVVDRERASLAVLRSCAGRGDVERAEAWLLHLEAAGVPPSIPGYNAMIHACARAADVPRAEHWLLEIIDRGLEPNLFSFNTLLGACAEAADIPAALKWAARMLQAGVEADVVTYRTLVATCARAGNVQLAEEWLEKMRRASHPPDIVSCSALISACGAAGDPQAAEAWLCRLQEEGLVARRAAYDPVIRAWCAGRPGLRELARAEGWLWKAVEAKVLPTDAALLGLLGAMVRAEDSDGVQRVIAAMQALGRWPLARATAILAQPAAGCGDFAAVEKLLESLREDGQAPDAVCWQSLLAAYARTPNPPRDGRIEACFGELHLLKGVKAETNAEVLGDLRRALGAEGYDKLAARLGLRQKPWIHRRAHAKSRIVGRLAEVAPCAPEEEEEHEHDDETMSSPLDQLLVA